MPTESQFLESELLYRVERRIDDGRLPVMTASSIRAAYGKGDKCVACEQRITESQVVYEVVDPRNPGTLIFHINCYKVWQHECARRIAQLQRERAQQAPQPGEITAPEGAPLKP